MTSDAAHLLGLVQGSALVHGLIVCGLLVAFLVWEIYQAPGEDDEPPPANGPAS